VCLVCGAENESGLGVSFYAARGRSLARASPRTPFQGFPGIVHGGVLAALLDDAMWYAVYSLGGTATLTGHLGVRYRRPVEPGRELLVLGEAFPPRHRVFPARAVVVISDTGEAVAEGEGRFREAEIPLPEPWAP
jgi:acyl-coenzyme A thioesterase PaaI-like protein